MPQRWKKFCHEYVVDLNGKQAAIRAGFSTKGAAVQASRLLTKANVIAEIERLKGVLQQQSGITAQMVIDELAKLAFSNIDDYLTGENEIQDMQFVEKAKTAAVAGLKTTTTYTLEGPKIKKEISLWDKPKALEMLGKHLGIFEADNNQKRAAIQINLID